MRKLFNRIFGIKPKVWCYPYSGTVRVFSNANGLAIARKGGIGLRFRYLTDNNLKVFSSHVFNDYFGKFPEPDIFTEEYRLFLRIEKMYDEYKSSKR